MKNNFSEKNLVKMVFFTFLQMSLMSNLIGDGWNYRPDLHLVPFDIICHIASGKLYVCM